MEIKFETMSEVKTFILYSDITFWAKDEKPWGGIGMIITDDMPKEIPYNATSSMDSAAFTDDRRDIILVTPFVHELSWLAGTFFRMPCSTELIPHFTDYMRDAYTAFLIMHKDKEYSAKEMLIYIVDFMDNMIRAICHTDDKKY